MGNACNAPLSDTPEDFYGDTGAIRKRWEELKGMMDEQSWLWWEKVREVKLNEDEGEKRNRAPVLVLCMDGDIGRMATAMLRAKGREAFCVEGGSGPLCSYLKGECSMGQTKRG